MFAWTTCCLLAFWAFTQTDAESVEVTCSSKKLIESRCPFVIGSSNLVVSVKRQLSRTKCIAEENYFIDGQDLVVRGGCRAVFLIETVVVDKCAGVTCQNGGVCKDGKCNCKPGFTGKFCQNAVNKCAGIACKNGGVCKNGKCNCKPGFTGPLCQTGSGDKCAGVTCQNGGVCRKRNGKCKCKGGFTGPFCQKNINDCVRHKCKNGAKCIDGVRKYTCQCKAGYTGKWCNSNINDCPGHKCKNGAKCKDGLNSYTCQCRKGFKGKFCETNINDCVGHQCENGAKCIDGVNKYTCECKAGYTGKFCKTTVDKCAGITCQNGGVCKGGNCNCKPGFTGPLCQTRVPLCPTGWLEHTTSCYLISNDHAPLFTEAERRCESKGGYLIEINSASENNFIAPHAKRTGLMYLYIGLTDRFQEGNWVYEKSRRRLTYSKWNPGEPNGRPGGVQNCAGMYAQKSTWDDIRCNNNFRYICEKDKV